MILMFILIPPTYLNDKIKCSINLLNSNINRVYCQDNLGAKVANLKSAAGQGLEPRLTVPETAVLPLDDPAMCNNIALFKALFTPF